jgi:phosphatidylserine/phosphatidylglycerophosphate/cardiolipin synthase-like enzyme
MTSILRPGRNCERVEPADSSGILVDARDYYLAFYEALLAARHTVLIAGWQFDSAVPLIRGEDAVGLQAPSELLPLLEHAIKARPELRIFVLAWDYSVLFAGEREWLQRVKFDWMTDERIRFVFDNEYPTGASHHQKLVAIDGSIAFTGGIDLCDARWDDSAHTIDNPLRFRLNGELQKSYHDVMAYCTGPVVCSIERLFCERWQRATGEALSLPPASRDKSAIFTLTALERAQPVHCSEVAISLTFGEHPPSGTPKVEQIKALHEDAIARAEKLVYIETQYFTSRAVCTALIERMRSDHSKLEIVLVLPMGADTPKENFALGATQLAALCALRDAADEHGHALRILGSVAVREDGSEAPTFIHSKVLIIDNRLMTIGSANCTNRSMSFDSELNLVWECTDDRSLSTSIARVRARLLSEHAGVEHDAAFEQTEGLVARIDALLGHSKLRLRELPASTESIPQASFIAQAFDPEKALTELELDELLEPQIKRDRA